MLEVALVQYAMQKAVAKVSDVTRSDTLWGSKRSQAFKWLQIQSVDVCRGVL